METKRLDPTRNMATMVKNPILHKSPGIVTLYNKYVVFEQLVILNCLFFPYFLFDFRLLPYACFHEQETTSLAAIDCQQKHMSGASFLEY
jgi:hypothetical protein